MRIIVFLLAFLLLSQFSLQNVNAQNTGRPIFGRIMLHTLAGGGVGSLAGLALWLTDPLGPQKFRENILLGFGLGCIFGFGFGVYQAFYSNIGGGEKPDASKDLSLFDNKSNSSDKTSYYQDFSISSKKIQQETTKMLFKDSNNSLPPVQNLFSFSYKY